MDNYVDDPMDICPMSPSPFARPNQNDTNLRFSTRTKPGGTEMQTCTSPICPINFPHAAGLFLQNGRGPRAQDITVFGGSNPPKFCWLAYEKCAAGAGTETDIRIVQSFREVHGNSTDPWAWAAEDQRWAQQIQRAGPEDVALSQGTEADTEAGTEADIKPTVRLGIKVDIKANNTAADTEADTEADIKAQTKSDTKADTKVETEEETKAAGSSAKTKTQIKAEITEAETEEETKAAGSSAETKTQIKAETTEAGTEAVAEVVLVKEVVGPGDEPPTSPNFNHSD
ncbi:hypothetical protein MMC29_004321 [Sticta canariensis]|nr:hypothetical protein [Sticta canariensis]